MACLEKTLTLSTITPDHGAPFLASLKADIIARLNEMWAQGLAQFLGIYRGSAQVGALVISVERDGPEKWLIVHALAARPVRGVDMTQEIFNRMYALAKSTGCDGIRIWTEREGLRRKMENQRGAKIRYVMEIKTDGV